MPSRTVPGWLRAARLYMRVTSPIAHLTRRFICTIDHAKLFGTGTTVQRRCVDIGAGTAPYRRELIERLDVTQYIPFDLAPSDSTTVVGDASTLPFATGSVQVVTSFEVIQHVPNSNAVLNEISRVLVPGGVLLLTFPFNYSECDVRDFRRWTLAGMEFDLRAQGFDVILVTPRGGRFFAFACWLNWSAQHLLPGQRQTWRMNRTPTNVARAVVVQAITLPTTIVQWLMLWFDQLFSNNGCYMGGAAIAVKPRTNGGNRS